MRAIGINTWVWASPLTDATVADLLRHVAGLGFDAVELPLEEPGRPRRPSAVASGARRRPA